MMIEPARPQAITSPSSAVGFFMCEPGTKRCEERLVEVKLIEIGTAIHEVANTRGTTDPHIVGMSRQHCCVVSLRQLLTLLMSHWLFYHNIAGVRQLPSEILRQFRLGCYRFENSSIILDKPTVFGFESSLRSIARLQLSEDARHMILYRAFGEKEFAGDFAVAGALRNKAKYLDFTFGQRFDYGVCSCYCLSAQASEFGYDFC